MQRRQAVAQRPQSRSRRTRRNRRMSTDPKPVERRPWYTITLELLPTSSTTATALTPSGLSDALLDSLGITSFNPSTAIPEFRLTSVDVYGTDITSATSNVSLVAYSLFDLSDQEPLITRSDRGGRATRAHVHFTWPKTHRDAIVSSSETPTLISVIAQYVQLKCRWRIKSTTALREYSDEVHSKDFRLQ